MQYTKKDVSDIFEKITSNSLVNGNSGSIIASPYINAIWASQIVIQHEDGTLNPIAEEDLGWEDS